MPPDFVSTEEIIQLARRRVHQGVWDYLVGGSESETTLRRNRLAFDRLAFRPRVLRDVSSIDTSTEFLGHKLRIPVMLAPVGSLQVFDPGRRRGSDQGSGGVRHHARAQLRHRTSAGRDGVVRRLPQDVPALRARRLEVDRGHHRARGRGGLQGAVRHGGRAALQPPRARDGGALGAADAPGAPRPVLGRCADVGPCRPHPRLGGAARSCSRASRRWRTR